ncbi:hypothetical protein [Kribbella sp. NPDC006257]|uniref:RipA family octameric membrane protein n=1 Tax=Kribbella sp. NPDC006257 TaxID=3156738 RepID=UPI0033BFB6F4
MQEDGLDVAQAPRSGFARILLTRFFGVAAPIETQSIENALWTTRQSPMSDQETGLLIEQYKLYVEMADRISTRRGIANGFFLTLNTLIFTAAGFFWQKPADARAGLVLFPWLVLTGQCLAWFLIIRSYRQLNTAKYVVIGALEERLPASPYWRAEWAALGVGRDQARYWPLSTIEQWIPMFFAASYVIGFIALIAA